MVRGVGAGKEEACAWLCASRRGILKWCMLLKEFMRKRLEVSTLGPKERKTWYYKMYCGSLTSLLVFSAGLGPWDDGSRLTFPYQRRNTLTRPLWAAPQDEVEIAEVPLSIDLSACSHLLDVPLEAPLTLKGLWILQTFKYAKIK